jgi:hypothetical protein
MIVILLRVRVAVWLNRYCIDAASGGEVPSSSSSSSSAV